ncbi:copper amine oxidase family protein [Striga asiatica]|uniref:Copper amine oxidase family protein n=1 Tax=Striga asiatica TaxID=4170 RepID=A0A5A7PR18_STRAF|nr:copper amine oxidase family protein [Striga asiatica]
MGILPLRNYYPIHLISSQPSSERHAGLRQPLPARNKSRHRESGCLLHAHIPTVTGPPYPTPHVRPRPKIPILPIIQTGQGKIGVTPSGPPLRRHQLIKIGLHDHGPRVRVGHDPAAVDGYARVLERVAPPLGCHHVGLAREGSADVDDAVLEDGGCIAEDDVYGTVDEARLVKLALGLDVEGVLKTERSEAERRATAWPLLGPAVLRNVIPRAMNPGPSTPENWEKFSINEGFTHGGGAIGREPVQHAPISRDHRVPHPFPHQRHVCHRPVHDHVLLVHPSPHVNHHPPFLPDPPPPHRILYPLLHRPEMPLPILRHHHPLPQCQLSIPTHNQLPLPPRHPPGERPESSRVGPTGCEAVAYHLRHVVPARKDGGREPGQFSVEFEEINTIVVIKIHVWASGPAEVLRKAAVSWAIVSSRRPMHSRHTSFLRLLLLRQPSRAAWARASVARARAARMVRERNSSMDKGSDLAVIRRLQGPGWGAVWHHQLMSFLVVLSVLGSVVCLEGNMKGKEKRRKKRSDDGIPIPCDRITAISLEAAISSEKISHEGDFSLFQEG